MRFQAPVQPAVGQPESAGFLGRRVGLLFAESPAELCEGLGGSQWVPWQR
jgi:hypothetical protein